MAVIPVELEPGLWRWSSIGQHHDEADPRRVSHHHAFECGDAFVVVDPVGFSAATPHLHALFERALAHRTLHVVMTDPHSVWTTGERLCREHGGAVWSSQATARLLDDPGLLRVLEPGEPGPGGVVAHATGGPTSDERTVWVPSHRTLVFGPGAVGDPADGSLALPGSGTGDDRTRRWLREAVVPAYDPLLDLPVGRIALRHGEIGAADPVDALLRALAAF